MILIPLENKATRGDQMLNAKYYENMGVADIIREQNLTPTLLLNKIRNFNMNLKGFKDKYKLSKQVNGRKLIIELINKEAKKKDV